MLFPESLYLRFNLGVRGRPLATERATRALVFKSLVRAWCRGLRVPVLSALQRLQDQGAGFIRDWLSGSMYWLCGHPQECPQHPHSLLFASRLWDFWQNGRARRNRGLCDTSPAYPNIGKAQRRGKEIFTDLLLSNKHVAVSPVPRQSRENHGREATQLDRTGAGGIRDAGQRQERPLPSPVPLQPTGGRPIQVFKRTKCFWTFTPTQATRLEWKFSTGVCVSESAAVLPYYLVSCRIWRKNISKLQGRLLLRHTFVTEK